MDHGQPVKSGPRSGAQRARDPRRELPAVSRLIDAVRARQPALPTWAAAEGARLALERARGALAGGAGGEAADRDALAAQAAALAAGLATPHPRRVVNATGVILHTNLGRAVLAEGAARAAFEAASAYSDLELDLRDGDRGDRLAPTARKLVSISGAEAAHAVNNNAAAVLLALGSLAAGREVLVSRGELVEIGGSFRVPEIVKSAGVRLVEVGTTNRTHPEDYRRAIGPQTALLFKVHRSNFEQRGFVAEVDLPELAAIGRERGLPVVEDLGSGTLVELAGTPLPHEVFAPDRLRRGADLVCFSGDKLLGGPQAGIVLGRRDLIERMRKNPLARALRLDKMTLAALDWTLAALLEGRAERDLPAVRALAEPVASVEARARRLAAQLAEVAGDAAAIAVEPDASAVGGGAAPGVVLDTWVVTVRSRSGPDRLAARLRGAPLPVLGRIRDDALALDARTLREDELGAVADALAGALAASSR
ncbi:MAG: L-seryl-tRNA(Sec) selenium transferase [Deltaproteobacteria bacterium]|nr:MAG: L-seryl-tRNA(Sec) selenium transferase [Deltaproteobacteria bacterium]